MQAKDLKVGEEYAYVLYLSDKDHPLSYRHGRLEQIGTKTSWHNAAHVMHNFESGKLDTSIYSANILGLWSVLGPEAERVKAERKAAQTQEDELIDLIFSAVMYAGENGSNIDCRVSGHNSTQIVFRIIGKSSVENLAEIMRLGADRKAALLSEAANKKIAEQIAGQMDIEECIAEAAMVKDGKVQPMEWGVHCYNCDGAYTQRADVAPKTCGICGGHTLAVWGVPA